MTSDNEKFQNILAEALGLYEKGMSIPEILDSYPDYKKELQEIFRTIQLFGREKEKVIPPKELLAKIISPPQLIGESQISKKVVFYKRGGVKSRPSSMDIIINQISNLMTWNWKVVLPIGIVAVLALGGLYLQIGREPQVAEEQPTPIAEKPTALPPATGNADDAVNAVITAVDNELAVLDEETADTSLVELDSQAISDFGQSYNENEL